MISQTHVAFNAGGYTGESDFGVLFESVSTGCAVDFVADQWRIEDSYGAYR